MFWDSVIAGLNVLTFWETYVAALEYLAIFLIPMFVVGIVIEKGNRIGATVGCLSMFVLPLFQVAAMIIFVLTLAPIIFGIGVDAAWSFPWAVLTIAPGTFFKMVGNARCRRSRVGIYSYSRPDEFTAYSYPWWHGPSVRI